MTADESGNPIRRSEDPVHHHGVTEASQAATGNETHDTVTGNGTHETTRTEHKSTQITNGAWNGTHGRATGPTGFAATTAGGQGLLHHRSDSSSSSSEDDGYGGRKKKTGMEEKINEKLPAGGNSDHNGTIDTPPPIDTIPDEKKGMMDKIKEKLPGHHETDHIST